MSTGPDQKAHGLGWQNDAKIKASYDSVINELGQPIAKPYTDFYSNDAL